MATRITPLTERAQTAVATISESVEASGAVQARGAMQESGEAIHALVEDLR